jgi:hypothetical protein
MLASVSAQEISTKATAALIKMSKKGFPGMLPKVLRTMAKVCHCPRELTLKDILCK